MSNVHEDFGRLQVFRDHITSEFQPNQIVMTCPCCDRFWATCYCHSHAVPVCHHARIVYTDGACSNNGKAGAVAGIGVAFGTHAGDPEDEDTHQFSIPVDDRLDVGARRTNQRAELLAALEGLKKLCDADQVRMAEYSENRQARARRGMEDSLTMVIVTTDSEYVVKGMTKWLPNWKRNGLRKANGKLPSNLDLFCELDAEVERRERRHNCGIRFWHIDRTYNTIADQLAKDAARAAGSNMDALRFYAMSALTL